MIERTSAGWKIAHIDAETGFSGGETQVLLLMEGLRERGHRCCLISPPGSKAEARARERHFETRAVSMRNDVDLPSVLKLRRTIDEVAPDLVHLHTGRATWLGGLAAKLAHRPAITTRRMDRDVDRGWRTRWIYGSLAQRAVAVSHAVKGCLEDGGVDRAIIDCVPDAIAPWRACENSVRMCTRGSLGVRDDAIVILTLASLTHRKGLDVLIEAIARLARRGVRPHVWIAGQGPQRAALSQQIEAFGLGDHVRLLGQRADAPALLSACDVFVLPARREGLGVAALEAMGAGRAVIATRVGGLAEVVVEDRTGVLVPPEDSVALANAIERLCVDERTRARLANAGPAHVAARYLAGQIVEAYESIYEAVIAAYSLRGKVDHS